MSFNRAAWLAANNVTIDSTIQPVFGLTKYIMQAIVATKQSICVKRGTFPSMIEISINKYLTDETPHSIKYVPPSKFRYHFLPYIIFSFSVILDEFERIDIIDAKSADSLQENH